MRLIDADNIKYVFNLTKTEPIYSGKDIERAINSMTTITNNKSHWIKWTDDYKDYCKCPFCDYGEEGEVLLGQESNFCPHCGADLR